MYALLALSGLASMVSSVASGRGQGTPISSDRASTEAARHGQCHASILDETGIATTPDQLTGRLGTDQCTRTHWLYIASAWAGNTLSTCDARVFPESPIVARTAAFRRACSSSAVEALCPSSRAEERRRGVCRAACLEPTNPPLRTRPDLGLGDPRVGSEEWNGWEEKVKLGK
ncbi:hypothetical protein V2G26_015681 [Clonostachys chloroleuca]